nr:oxidoreductase [Cryobacterium sp.]
MTATLAPATAAPRRLTGVGMKLISLDTQFDGTIVDILGYRTAPAGRVEVTAILDAPGAWYSRTYPVVLDASDVRLSLALQSITRTELGVR